MLRNPDPVWAMSHFLGRLIGTCGRYGSREIVPSGNPTKSKQPSHVPIDSPTGSGSQKVGAVCQNLARTDLCGGRSVMGDSTAIPGT